MSMERKRFQYVCPICGGCDIRYDATAAWNVKTQTMELVGTNDTAYCETCDGTEISTVAVELPKLPEVWDCRDPENVRRLA